ncbi:hypothetical protein WJX77_001587 [Trebouxia sp. C0004]
MLAYEGQRCCFVKPSAKPSKASIMLALPAGSAASQAAETGKSTEASTSIQVVKPSIIAQVNVNEEIDGTLPTCPICLTEIAKLTEKAVLNNCMHVFCVDCISRWASKKRVCPLCKGRIQGYIYNIQSEQDYQQRIIPPSPERPSSPPVRSALLSRWGPSSMSLLQSVAASLSASQGPTQRQQDVLQQWRDTAQYYFGSSSQQLSHAGRQIIVRPSQASRQRQNSRNTAGQREPRPYYFRVQQQMQAGAGQAQRNELSVVASSEDPAIAWRRNIYADGMYAVSSGSQSPAVPTFLAGAPNRARRLQDWVKRELQALLHQENVSVVRSFVMSLATAHCLDRHQGQQQQAAGSARQEEEAVNALQPFLHDRAAHFWHELKCFAEAPYSMATYDRMIQYQRRQNSEQNTSRELICSLPQPQQPVVPTAWVPPSHANAASPSSRPAYTSRPAARSHPAARDAADHSYAAVHTAHVIDLTADDQASRSPSIDSDLMMVSQPLADAAAGHAAQTARTHGNALQAASTAPDQTQDCVSSRGLLAARQRPAAAVSGVAQRQHGHPEHEVIAVVATRKRSRWDMRPADMQATVDLCPPVHHAQAEHSQTQQQIRPVPYSEDAMLASAEAVSDRLAPCAGARDSRHSESAEASRDQLDQQQQETCLSSSQFPSGSHISDTVVLKRLKREHSGRLSRRSEQAQDRQSRPRRSSHRINAKRKEPRHRHSHKPRLSQVVHSPISDIDHRMLAHNQAQLDCHAGHDSPGLDRWQMW